MEKDKNIIENQKVDAAPQPQGEAGAPEFKSIGWRAHNEITYRGVDFLLNSIIGVTFAYWAQRTKTGLKYFGEPTAAVGRAVMRPFTSNPATLEEGSKWGSRIASIIVGGTTIIPPMTILENKKVKHAMVRAIDEMAYGKEAVENEQRFAELRESINHEPKKDFWTGMAARIVVLIPMFAWTMTPKLNDPTKKYAYEPMAKGTKFLADNLGIKAAKMKSTRLDGQTNWDFLHETIAMDCGLTFIYSFLHEYAFKAFAAIRNPDKQPAAPAPVVVTTAITEPPSKDTSPATKFAERILREPQTARMAMGAA